MMEQRRTVYSIATRQKSVKLYSTLKETGSCIVNGEEITTCSELARKLNVKNESTIRTWASKSWNKSSIIERSSKRGRKSKLSKEQKAELRA
jgi:transposase-like protein